MASSTVQSIIFDRRKYTVEKAKNWLKKHGYKYGDVDKKTNHIRFRQVPPGTFKYFRTKEISDGIKLILGFK